MLDGPRATGVAVIATLAVTGCSLSISRPDSYRPSIVAPTCTRRAPLRKTADLGGALGFGSFGLFLLQTSIQSDGIVRGGDKIDPALIWTAVGLTVVGVAYAAALVTGVRRTNRCSEAYGAHAAWLTDPANAGQVAAVRATESARRAERRRAACAERRERTRASCDHRIRDYEEEQDPIRNARLWRDMPEACKRRMARERATPPAPEPECGD